MKEVREKPFDPYRGPYTLDGVGGLLYAVLEELTEIKKIFQEYVVLEGDTITNTFILPTGVQVTKIDWVEAKHAGVPAGVSLEVPLKKVAHLDITNLGPGVVFYSTNKGLAQFEAAELIEPGETAKIHLKKRAMSQLNIVANNQAAKVRVTVLV